MPEEREAATQNLAGLGAPMGFFEGVLDRLPTGVVIFDRQLRLLYLNAAARRVVAGPSSLRPGEPLPEPWPDLSLRSIGESLFSQEPSIGVRLVETRDRLISVEGLAATDGSTATLLLEDVTERERTRRAERQFVENAAHELRTPLAAILSVVDVLQNGAKDDAEALTRFLGHIRSHSERLVRLATSLLVLARIQTGREQPRLEVVPVRPLLTDIANDLSTAGPVEVEVRAAEQVAVLADHDLLCRAVENVAGNASRETREGRITLAARDLGDSVEIEVADTGPGMTRTEALHAFDRFYRSPTRDTNGFGLGLAIADEAIRALGGTISLEAEPNAGTRVRITLPSARIVS
jgi:signal transduction histidine kinase